MKATVKQTNYFSAYPLKVLERAMAEAPESPQRPHLKALLTKKTSPNIRLRVTPMINPYKLPAETPSQRITPPVQKEPEGGEWFNHYE